MDNVGCKTDRSSLAAKQWAETCRQRFDTNLESPTFTESLPLARFAGAAPRPRYSMVEACFGHAPERLMFP